MAATEQANKWGIGSLLGWKGLMGDASRGVRITSIVFLIILSCSMVATQTNYLVIGSTHVIAVLAPIAAGSLLFGVRCPSTPTRHTSLHQPTRCFSSRSSAL